MATKSKKFAVGDWVIHDFAMKQVKSVDGSHYCVSDGAFETSGNLELREATYKTKYLADVCRHYYDKLHQQYGHLIRNWPELNRWFDARCIEMIDSMKDEKAVQALCADTQEFYNQIVQDCESRRDTRIRGLALYTR